MLKIKIKLATEKAFRKKKKKIHITSEKRKLATL